MKAMKKLSALFITAIIAMAQSSCDSDDVYHSFYHYRNECSTDIRLTSYRYRNGELLEDPDYTFVIPCGETHTLRFDTEGNGSYPYPFMWTSPTGADYVRVTNGIKQFINTRHSFTGEDKLFREESYEILKTAPKDRTRTYQYVFTDKDFDGAELVDPVLCTSSDGPATPKSCN